MLKIASLDLYVDFQSISRHCFLIVHVIVSFQLKLDYTERQKKHREEHQKLLDELNTQRKRFQGNKFL